MVTTNDPPKPITVPLFGMPCEYCGHPALTLFVFPHGRMIKHTLYGLPPHMIGSIPRPASDQRRPLVTPMAKIA